MQDRQSPATDVHRVDVIPATDVLGVDVIMAAFSGGSSWTLPASCSGSPSLCMLQSNPNVLSEYRPVQSRMSLMPLMATYHRHHCVMER